MHSLCISIKYGFEIVEKIPGILSKTVLHNLPGACIGRGEIIHLAKKHNDVLEFLVVGGKYHFLIEIRWYCRLRLVPPAPERLGVLQPKRADQPSQIFAKIICALIMDDLDSAQYCVGSTRFYLVSVLHKGPNGGDQSANDFYGLDNPIPIP